MFVPKIEKTGGKKYKDRVGVRRKKQSSGYVVNQLGLWSVFFAFWIILQIILKSMSALAR